VRQDRDDIARRSFKGGQHDKNREANGGERHRQPRYNNDHPDRTWERRWRGDRDDDDGPAGRHDSHMSRLMSARCVGQEPVHRERERSPPRRHWGEQQGGRRKGAAPDEEEPFARLPPTLDLRQLQEAELRFLFRAQAASIQDVVTNLLKNHSVKLVHDLVVPSMDDYILKATALADNLGLESEPLLAPVAVVGDEALRSPLHLKANACEPPTDIPVKSPSSG